MELKHIGVKRRSGRYPWGSGENPEQRGTSLLGRVNELRKQGLNEKERADALGMTIQQVRDKKSLEKDLIKQANRAQAEKMRDKGMSNVAIGKAIGRNESYVRGLLDPRQKERSEITNTISNLLKNRVEEKKYIDVGLGTERHLGISRTKLKVAISKLEDEGYRIHKFDVEQIGTGKPTTMMVLTKNDVDYGEVTKNKHLVRMVQDYSEDGGKSFSPPQPIKNVDSKKIQIRYNEEGGSDKDGVIELRRGVKDLSLGNSKYAQVRIGVDGTHFLKGMAIYADDLPKGIDIIYNTNKKIGTPKEKVFKEMKTDPLTGKIDLENPFGAVIKAGGQRGALNVVNEEGDWNKWSRSISSQILSKQAPSLAAKQLDLAYNAKKEEYDQIMALTNPVVKKKLLESFADGADSDAVHLKAAALPRQSSHIILPVPSMKETEVYAPNYNNGEKVVLIRHPHGGIFEIPELTVNNKQPNAKSILGTNPKDAIGIHPKVAEKLSGADFDGDSVIVIPNQKGHIKTAPSLKDLVDFDTQSYKLPPDAPKMTAKTKGIKMGMISNLITDMTIKGADPKGDEIARAVKHSMVVIDAEKHHLDYKRSYIENGISALNKKYQGKASGGAVTLISKASSEIRVYREDGIRVPTSNGKTKKIYVDPNTGKKLYTPLDKYTTTKDGKRIMRKSIKSTRMAETDDPFKLSSGTMMESVYATHASKLKALANESRKEALRLPNMELSKSAKLAYKTEIESLKSKLSIAERNKPLERQAHLIAGSVIRAKIAANPYMDKNDLKKIKGLELQKARNKTMAKKQNIDITDKEWEAIQSGAISTNVLIKILNNTDTDKIKSLATPRNTKKLTSSTLQRVKMMLNNGYTQSEIADQLGVSTSLINKSIGGV